MKKQNPVVVEDQSLFVCRNCGEEVHYEEKSWSWCVSPGTSKWVTVCPKWYPDEYKPHQPREITHSDLLDSLRSFIEDFS